MTTSSSMQKPNILIVGGGAGGLELATRLGRTLGKQQKADITLIDPQRIHLWKPLLHEVVAGSFDTGSEALSYRAHSSENHYYFRMGSMIGLDREAKQITLAPLLDHHKKEVLPERVLDYDYLVIAVGAHTNDFGIPGVHDYCFTMDNAEQAEDFHLCFLNRYMQYSESDQEQRPVHIAIVGAGATGVELAAELYNAVDRLAQFGVRKVQRDTLDVSLIEVADRILPALPESLSSKAQDTLLELGVTIRTHTMVKQVDRNQLTLASGDLIHSLDADFIVWAAGVQAPSFLSTLGLPTNRIHQLCITPTLHIEGEEHLFAIGDCAYLLNDVPVGDSVAPRPVPPTAQAAHQMAELLTYNLCALIEGKPLKSFIYHDHGTLVSLSRFQTLGNVLDELFKRSWSVDGHIAFWAYASLYRQHQLTLHGFWKTFGLVLAHLLEKRLKPRLKLY